MTDQDREGPRRSFVYGNTKIENDAITRQTVDEAARELGQERGERREVIAIAALGSRFRSPR